MDCVLLPFGLFPAHIAASPGRNARITPLPADDMLPETVPKSGKADLQAHLNTKHNTLK